jgi:hypothetical protein
MLLYHKNIDGRPGSGNVNIRVYAAFGKWNTRYLKSAVVALRQVEDVPDHLLAHLSPLGWEHVNRRSG